MKKYILLSGLLLFALSISAQSRANHPKKSNFLRSSNPYTLSFSPVHFAFSTLDVGIERKMDQQTGLMLRGSAGFRNTTLWEGLGGTYKNYTARLEFRHYFQRQENSSMGAYTTLWSSAHRATFTTELAKKKYELVRSSGFKIGAGVGWKFNLLRKWPGISIDLQVGGAYKLGEVKGKYAEKSRSVIFKDKGFLPAAGLQFGFQLGKTYEKKNTEPAKNKTVTADLSFHSRYSRSERKQIEKALKKAGFQPGKANGWITEKTIQAIKAFQKRNGLHPDGLVGKETARRLKVKLD